MPSHSLWHHCNVTRYPDCSLELMCQKSLKCIYPSTGSFESELTRWNGNLEPQWQHNTVFNPLWLKLVYWMNYRPLQWYRWCCDQWSIISEESSFYFVPAIQYLSIAMHGSVMDIYVISVLQCWSPFYWHVLAENRTWVSNDIPYFMCNVITQSCLNFNHGLTSSIFTTLHCHTNRMGHGPQLNLNMDMDGIILPFRLRHGWVITPKYFTMMYLFNHAMIHMMAS